MGVCGSFMGGIALLAKALGHKVSGSDAKVYPPMNLQLKQQGIELMDPYDAAHLQPPPDLVIIGNAVSRGNPEVEHILNNKLPYISGPQWLSESLLKARQVIAVSGTHGKTTTSAMLGWLLKSAHLEPSFLIGGIPQNFGVSACLGGPKYFIIEADEYDTAFFDKRSKFIHYCPDILVINNIEFDHADIFPDLATIRREFHHLLRIMPEKGLIVAKYGDLEIAKVLEMGCWASVEYFGENGAKWAIEPLTDDYSHFNICCEAEPVGTVRWELIGRFNAENALAAVAAADHIGITPTDACIALRSFKSVKRRLEQLAQVNNIVVYDDFAHHPTAIQATLRALRQKVKKQRIIAVTEPRSNTMRQGIHKHKLAAALADADIVFLYQAKNLVWDPTELRSELRGKCRIMTDIDEIAQEVTVIAKPGDHILVMSNGGFGDVHQKIIDQLVMTPRP